MAALKMDDTPLPQPEEISELQGDPSRQAISLFKGIDYQIWQTVLAWMDLGENEILAVEGADDFDNLRKSSATVNQVKNLASPPDCSRHQGSMRIQQERACIGCNYPLGSR
jgi:hypothetical protein